jgi:PST family polysaccharide transporter
MDNSSSLSERILSAGSWGILGTFSNSAIRLLASIAVARLLIPEDFAVAALAGVIMETVTRFTDFGVSAAIIREKEKTEQLSQTLFWSWIGFVAIICLLVVSSSQLVAKFYEETRLPLILSVMSFGLIAAGLNTVPLALLEKQIKLKEINLLRMAATTSTSILAVAFAIASTGYWALIIPSVIIGVLQFPILLRLSGFQPRFYWTWHDLRKVLSFGTGVFLARICVFFSDNADYFFLGKYLPKSVFGQYYFAYTRSRLPYSTIAPALQAPLLAAFSQIRDNPKRLREALIRVARVHFSVLAPIGLWLTLLADPLIVTIFGQQWRPSIPIIQVYSIFFMFVAGGGFGGAPLLAMGKSWLLSALQAFRLISVLSALIWGVVTNQSILSISIAVVVMNLPAYIFMTGFIFRKVGLSLSEIWQAYRGCFLALIISGICFTITRLCGWHPASVGNIVYLLGGMLALFAGYSAGSWIFNSEFTNEIVGYLRTKFERNHAPFTAKVS